MIDETSCVLLWLLLKVVVTDIEGGASTFTCSIYKVQVLPLPVSVSERRVMRL